MNINLIKTSQYLRNFHDDTLLSATDYIAHNLNANNKKKLNSNRYVCVGRSSQ